MNWIYTVLAILFGVGVSFIMVHHFSNSKSRTSPLQPKPTNQSKEDDTSEGNSPLGGIISVPTFNDDDGDDEYCVRPITMRIEGGNEIRRAEVHVNAV
mmetsp:Transcript_2611/g.3485  ORF Transcript_2611/g.3485 Transcript_2611/m.3485 type:complete len:98 (-) Transcript_2611:112-405(-)|eukprot:CAMPEP_0198146238 /NCGR_PEP_ID=MMETSP1443-20131203/28306_1 /TAXON_ID=186043 /ORGANISM="Entomoneis sp., Strain CCMP2396" /LENGTH=97 /DNA_ID=CAMNT_0043810127 /DNA_START=207 /DNA_END=500 /DNA_ORIENTATION=-